MRTSRPARLTSGGPTWDLRTPKKGSRPARQSPVSEANAAMALNDAITVAAAALGKGDVAQARHEKARLGVCLRCYILLKQPVSVARLECSGAG